MSVNTNPTADTSTSNANWGTIVIVLIVVVIGMAIAYATMQPHDTPQAIVVSPTNSAPPTAGPGVPVPSSAPGGNGGQ